MICCVLWSTQPLTLSGIASADNGWPHDALRTVSLAHDNQMPLSRL